MDGYVSIQFVNFQACTERKTGIILTKLSQCTKIGREFPRLPSKTPRPVLTSSFYWSGIGGNKRANKLISRENNAKAIKRRISLYFN